METHIKIVGVLHLIQGAIGACIALFLILLFGGAAGIVGLAADPDEAMIAVPVVGVVGLLAASVVGLLALPALLAGLGVLRLRPWGRILVIVVSAFNLMNVPLGTLVGLYSLGVMLAGETAEIFDPEARRLTVG